MLDTCYGWLDTRMADREWAVGEGFTLADCAAAPALFYADWVHPIGDARPHVVAYRARLLDHQKVIRGDVTTAIPIAADKVRALEQGLGQATGRRVVLEPRVDPAIIGGVITRIGSTVYDGSVTTQLQKMKEALTESAQ